MKIVDDYHAYGKAVSYIKAIAEHLINKAKNDPLLQETLNKPNKSLKGMFEYVKSEARKLAKDGCAVVEDEKVYALAQHYYDEDSLDFEPKEKKEVNPKTPQEKKVKKVDKIELPEMDMDDFEF
ncbi:hypothetical protein A4S06_05270 [Erysipelotrichaceae bacterium MTC7]|nr:hypothetical protein A4S06_05270 [Erysipelotrichaceae bacterium MTC7]